MKEVGNKLFYFIKTKKGFQQMESLFKFAFS